MKLKCVILKNFRGYNEQIVIPIEDLTVFIGKNDVGKSTILEALEIFFNKSSKLVKIDRQDLCVSVEETEILIGCVFEVDKDSPIVIDATAETTLAQEFLLNQNDELEVYKTYKCSEKSVGTPKTALKAYYPTNESASDLFQLKQADLRKRIDALGLGEAPGLNRSSNVSMRQTIFANVGDLLFEDQIIETSKHADSKQIEAWLEQHLPMYALFQSDRASKDGDTEVQDPMKLAIKTALRAKSEELNAISDSVIENLKLVADTTIQKLKEMSPEVADQLVPNFKKEPEWEKAFSFSLTDDQDVAVNKRGSGVRRLILLNFFRADAERRARDSSASQIIYAVEEPETSQHPDHQKQLLKALSELAETENSQAIITTHVPGLAGLVPVESIRFLENTKDGTNLRYFETEPEPDELFTYIAQQLGVHPNHEVKALFFVEGVNDVEFFSRISSSLSNVHDDIVDLASSNKVAFVPVGGGTLKQWVEKKYLSRLNFPQFHVYDLEDEQNPPSKAYVDELKQSGHFAELTSKKMLENYLHPDAIEAVYGFKIQFGNHDKVPLLTAKQVHIESGSQTDWDSLTDEKKDKKISRAKKRLNRDCVDAMTPDLLLQSDPENEIISWLKAVSAEILSN